MTQMQKVFDRELAIEQAGGMADLADELFAMLLKELPDHREALEQAIEDNDGEKLLYHTHQLNGAAAYNGVPALKAAANTLETALKNGAESSEALSAQLLEEIDRVLACAER